MSPREERSMSIKSLLVKQMQGGNAWGGRPARRLRAGSGTGCLAVARQRKDEQGAGEMGVFGQVPEAADCAQAIGGFPQPGRHADAGPAADARVDADILLAFEQIGEDVANNAGGGLELPKLLAVLDAD